MVGKYYVPAYIYAQQVYVEEAWRLHENGSFADPVTSTVGAIVNGVRPTEVWLWHMVSLVTLFAVRE